MKKKLLLNIYIILFNFIAAQQIKYEAFCHHPEADLSLKDQLLKNALELPTCVFDIDETLIKAALMVKADPDLSSQSVSPLHKACLEERLNIIKILLDAKADVNRKDSAGNTPLHYAIISNKKNSALELIAYMRRNNPRTSTGHFNPLLDFCNKYDDWNPLQTAVYFNNLELVEALLDSGANPNSCSNQRIKCRVRGANITVEVFIDMPLHMASSNGNIEIINKLINFGASKSLINYNSGTALHIAAKKGDTVCLSALLDRGCDPLIVNIKRQNAFDVAPEKVRAFMIDYLKSKQALKA